MRFQDLTGRQFGRLTVLRRTAENSKDGRPQWECQCVCGERVVLRGASLRTGNTRSCGCLQKESVGALRRTHGGSNTDEYETWLGMKKRCLNHAHHKYPEYGGRGIVVCDRWRNSFENFILDMGPKPSPQHSLDRIDNDGPYDKDNCRWATSIEQSRNRRQRRWKKKPLSCLIKGGGLSESM